MLFRRNKPEELPREIPRRKWWLPPLIGFVALAALAVAGLKLYRHYEPQRLARRAQTMMDAGDFRGAALTLTRALQINSASDPATRVMADLMERMQMPQTIEWRRRLAELNPGSMPDALAWAQVALREGKPTIADHALGTVAVEQRGSAEWHSAAGLSAIRAGRWQTAREHFLEASRLDPGSDLHRYNLALAQLQSPKAGERTAALGVLGELDAKGRVGLFAQRATILQLARDGKTDAAIAKSAALVADEAAGFPDHLTHVELLRKTGRADAGPALNAAKAAASRQGLDAGAMINWFRLHEQADEGLKWADSLAPEVAEHRAVLAARGECLLVLKRWADLRVAAAAADWGPANVRRLAFLARAENELGDVHGSNTSWANALQLAKSDRGQLARLAALAAEWKWKSQMRDALWAAAQSAGPDWALRTLHHSYAVDGDTAGILRVAKRQLEIDPNDQRARNNSIHCSLLLGADLPQSLELARRLAGEAPGDPVIVSTYAHALLANGMPDEALAEIEKLPAAALQQPAIALYHGLALFGTGDVAKAQAALALAEKAPLLPEEKALLSAARRTHTQG